jgi:hypothetical protein
MSGRAPARSRHLTRLQMLILALEESAAVGRQPTWSQVVRLACRYGAKLDPPLQAHELDVSPAVAAWLLGTEETQREETDDEQQYLRGTVPRRPDDLL